MNLSGDLIIEDIIPVIIILQQAFTYRLVILHFG